MRQLPFLYASEPERKRPSLKPWLQFALALIVLAFCTVVMAR